jgi:hypothetical protein
MSTQIQYRRGTTAENNAFTGALAEITVDTTNNTLRVHDGVTAGGFATVSASASQTLSNKTFSSPTFTGTVTGNLIPVTDNTYTLGNATSSWSALYVAGNTIYLGNLQLKEASANTFAVFTSDGVTQANLDVGNIDVSALTQGTSTIGLAGVNGNAYITVAGTANVLVVSSTGANITGTVNASGNANVGNIGATNAVLSGALSGVTTINASGNASVGNIGATNAVFTGTAGVTGNITGGNLSTGGVVTATGNVTGGNIITTGVVQAGNLKVSGIEAVTTLNVTGDTLISGNLTVSGTTVTANVASLVITDPILGLGRGANGAPLTTNDGLDRGIEMFYYTDAEQVAFMGYDNSAGKIISAANASVANNIVTVNSYGTTVVGTLEGTNVNVTGNVAGGNLTTTGQVVASGNVSGNFFIGNGSQLSGIDATSIQSGTSNVRVVSSGGNVTVGIAGTSNVVVINNATTTISGNMLANMVFTANTIPSGANINQVGYNGLMAGPLLISDGANFTVTTSITII